MTVRIIPSDYALVVVRSERFVANNGAIHRTRMNLMPKYKIELFILESEITSPAM